MFTRLLALCGVAAATLLAAPAAAQEEAGAPGTPTPAAVDLRGRLGPGTEQRFEMTIDTLLHLQAPQPPAGSAAAPQAPPVQGGHAGGPVEQKQEAHQW